MELTIPQFLGRLVHRAQRLPGRVETVSVDENGEINGFVLNGFSKSSTAECSIGEENGVPAIIMKTRYDTVHTYQLYRPEEGDVEDAFDWLVERASWWWNRSYGKGYGVPSVWQAEFERKGYSKTATKTIVYPASYAYDPWEV
jgi:hypothetical protein